MASLNDIRTAFLDYFARHDHEIVPSSPLVPRNDPTLLFTNAGMVQFKNVFTGLEQRDYKRAVTAQKCLRAGGKHNDLDNVGYTARHHTFFEMLGNFSFGDYFKELAIPLAWDLVTKDFGLAKDRLLITVYEDDDEAAAVWKQHTGLPDERIIRIAGADNFWSMGPTGPCGPCSEIFYDHGPEIPGGPPGSADEDGDRFVEIWNLVFMQFEQFEDGRRESLPRPSIDTGMGLERIGAVLQGKHDNYDTDLMRALIEASAHASSSDPDGPHKVHHRVIADHLRATAFLIADGVLPMNEGRGYVLRRIMRRAMRHAHLVGVDRPLMHRLVPALIQQMGQAYPELIRAQALIAETLEIEEKRFRDTLERGLRLLADELEHLPDAAPLPGDVAFKLYDTYGFPLDLTQDALRELGRTVDLDGFNRAMAEQKARARAAWSGSGDAREEAIWFDLREEIGATDFLGYETERAEGVIGAVVRDGKRVDAAKAGETVRIVLNQTPFYAEAGGQVGDQGTLRTPKGRARVTDAQRRAETLFVHEAVVEEGEIVEGEAAELAVDGTRRARIRANHSATHLMHEALRGRLGEHVAQRGSLVAPDRLRFDFTQPRPMTPDDIAAVEAEVNRYIRQNDRVSTRIMTPEAAEAAGARALFGEKYGDEVRVVAMGCRPPGESGPAGEIYSMELCGGTHVTRTGEIGVFKIVSEGATSAGVRRVEALTGAAALAYLAEEERALQEIAAALRVPPQEAAKRVKTLIDERKALQAEVADLKRKIALSGIASAKGTASGTGSAAGAGAGIASAKGTASGTGSAAGAGANAAASEVKEIKGVKFVARSLADISPKDLRGLIDEYKSRLGSGAVLLITETDGKAAVAAGVTEDLTGRISAIDLVRAAVEAVGGKGGGGRPDMAQGGGPDPSKAEEAIRAAEALLEAQAAA